MSEMYIMQYKRLIIGVTLTIVTNFSYSLTKNYTAVRPAALKAALRAYQRARAQHQLGPNKRILTIVDFSLPSYQRRLWVIDLKSHQILMNLYTTQGKNSGLVYATHFSNQLHSQQSSLGLFRTRGEYIGHHGLSMRLQGLEPGINDHAMARAVVIHSAWYASPQFVKKYHRTGRSWGCFAVAPRVERKLLETLKGGSAVFAYYSDHPATVTL